jgi:hypothetical protein
MLQAEINKAINSEKEHIIKNKNENGNGMSMIF